MRADDYNVRCYHVIDHVMLYSFVSIVTSQRGIAQNRQFDVRVFYISCIYIYIYIVYLVSLFNFMRHAAERQQQCKLT